MLATNLVKEGTELPRISIASLHYLTAFLPGENERKDCVCPKCPSYPDCAVDPDLRLFCMRGRAPCPIQRRGCMCPGCKVHSRHKFTRDFYCDVGTEEEQSQRI